MFTFLRAFYSAADEDLWRHVYFNFVDRLILISARGPFRVAFNEGAFVFGVSFLDRRDYGETGHDETSIIKIITFITVSKSTALERAVYYTKKISEISTRKRTDVNTVS